MQKKANLKYLNYSPVKYSYSVTKKTYIQMKGDIYTDKDVSQSSLAFIHHLAEIQPILTVKLGQ
jgi:hypothetical protein